VEKAGPDAVDAKEIEPGYSCCEVGLGGAEGDKLLHVLTILWRVKLKCEEYDVYSCPIWKRYNGSGDIHMQDIEVITS